jgi:hypothetical protein
LLVPTGDGDSFEVVLGPVITLVISEEASPEQKDLLVVEPIDNGLALVTGEPSHVSLSLDERPLMITDSTVSPESSSSWVEDLTEQLAADHDYELDKSWLEEQLLDSPDVGAQANESPVEAHVSPGTSHLLCYFIIFSCLVYLHLYFILQLGLVCLQVFPRQLMYPLLPPVSPISGDEATCQIFFLFISSLIMMDYLTFLFHCRYHTRGRETRFG